MLILFVRFLFVACGGEMWTVSPASSIANLNQVEIKSPGYFQFATYMVNIYRTVKETSNKILDLQEKYRQVSSSHDIKTM